MNNRYDWTLKPTRLIRFEAKLHMQSGLHIGSGRESTYSDASVVRHADGRPFIPGSSLKGVMRSHLERMGQVLEHVRACLLHDTSMFSDEEKEKFKTPKVKKIIEEKGSAEIEGGTDLVCISPLWVLTKADATRAKAVHFKDLCHICTLFGSQILAGKVRIPDLEVEEMSYIHNVEIRDGVGIDRDRGVAVDGVKYDFEVVPSDTVFKLNIFVDSPSPIELGLLAAGIREMQQGHVAIGGKTTRGLGAFSLKDLAIYETKYNGKGLKAHLLNRESVPVKDTEKFLDQKIEQLFQGEDYAEENS